MKAGAYRNPVTIQKLRAAVDPATCDRGDASNFETLVTRRAKIKKELGTETFEGQQLQPTVKGTFWIRNDATVATITPAMRILSGSEVWDIVTVTTDGYKQLDVVITATKRL